MFIANQWLYFSSWIYEIFVFIFWIHTIKQNIFQYFDSKEKIYFYKQLIQIENTCSCTCTFNNIINNCYCLLYIHKYFIYKLLVVYTLYIAYSLSNRNVFLSPISRKLGTLVSIFTKKRILKVFLTDVSIVVFDVKLRLSKPSRKFYTFLTTK